MNFPIRRLTLTEYKTEPSVPLTREECRALLDVAKGITVTPSLDQEGCYDLTPDSRIGAINLGALSIEIRPKVPVDRVLFLVSYALNPERWNDTPFDFGEESSLVEAIIPGFVAHVTRAFSRGILQGYRAEEDALTTVRGRVRFDDQLRDRYGRFPPVEVRFDEFTEDIELNRLVKATIHRLGKLRIRSELARRSLRAFDRVLAPVQLVQYDRRSLPDIDYNRLNQHYRPAVELAKLILRSEAIELRHGKVHATTFLVDMNDVFEDFVVVALRDALRVSASVFPQGARGKAIHLDTAASVRLEPDISWWHGNSCMFVGDVKYKRVNVPGILHPDLYQLLAYAIATDLPGGLLIYAAGEGAPTSHEVIHLGKKLHVTALDVRGTPEEILAEIQTVARRIRALRHEAARLRVAA
jgi:5-methylcytosine-specific restriction enzyme subunit McrC